MKTKTARWNRRSPGPGPELVLAPLAWLKLQFLLHAGDTEIGGFGVSHEQNLLYVEDVAIVSQRTTAVSVEFADTAVADFFDEMADRKIPAQRFMRIWMHTHPGHSAEPSCLDETTFARAFGPCDWALMFIIARSGEVYARLRVNGGPGAEMLIPVRIDWCIRQWNRAEASLVVSVSTPRQICIGYTEGHYLPSTSRSMNWLTGVDSNFPGSWQSDRIACAWGG